VTVLAGAIFSVLLIAPPGDKVIDVRSRQAPTVPTDLTVVTASTSSIQLDWTASTDDLGVVGYKIFRDTLQVGTSASPSFLDTGLTANTSYAYQISVISPHLHGALPQDPNLNLYPQNWSWK
jgi:hypothetical protein